MSGGYVREATESDAIILAPFLREMDCIEITAVSGKNPLEGLLDVFSAPNAKVHSIVQNDGTIMGIFGVTDCAHGSGYGVPFLLASNQLEQHSKEFLRHCKKWVKELESEYPCLYNFIHTQNFVAMRWLQWCGFEVKQEVEYGIGKEPFYLFMKENN
tara:strand:+ start:470 stop:940 length:471 start_codon:yes stop_codon:yes gene_type:complete